MDRAGHPVAGLNRGGQRALAFEKVTSTFERSPVQRPFLFDGPAPSEDAFRTSQDGDLSITGHDAIGQRIEQLAG